ncbi:A1S_2505 family phage non-structural protein [Pelomicrobium methylotrophicum]|nr:DUF4326 domain-containing protein [Pelomicrobium methylotrophicum]
MRILNRRHLVSPWPAHAVWVGRPTPLGNPFVIGRDGSREEVIARYREWLEARIRERDPAVLTAMAGLREDSSLVCACAPEPCHAEAIREAWMKHFRDGIVVRPAYHEDGSIPLDGEVFVFGSNLAGRHGAGAAAEAFDRFGARRGVGEGYMGEPPRHCYAIPTKDERLAVLSLDKIAAAVGRFVEFAASRPELRFFVTRVGCGLAGYRDEQIAPLFAGAPLARCSFPRPWRRYLEPRSMAYAGGGARHAPLPVLRRMTRIAQRLEARGYVLRTGGGNDTDSAFEAGCAKKEVFLPWPGFNGRTSAFDSVSEEALAVASAAHPAFRRLTAEARLLAGRESHRILGADLRTPADFLVCWTPDGAQSEAEIGRETGEAALAIALADRWAVPVFNLARADALERLAALLDVAAG